MARHWTTTNGGHGFAIVDLEKIPKGFEFKEIDYNEKTKQTHLRIIKTIKTWKQCESTKDRWHCTKEIGHKGEHRSTINKKIYKKWKQ